MVLLQEDIMKHCTVCHKPVITDYIVRVVSHTESIFFHRECYYESKNESGSVPGAGFLPKSEPANLHRV